MFVCCCVVILCMYVVVCCLCFCSGWHVSLSKVVRLSCEVCWFYFRDVAQIPVRRSTTGSLDLQSEVVSSGVLRFLLLFSGRVEHNGVWAQLVTKRKTPTNTAIFDWKGREYKTSIGALSTCYGKMWLGEYRVTFRISVSNGVRLRFHMCINHVFEDATNPGPDTVRNRRLDSLY